MRYRLDGAAPLPLRTLAPPGEGDFPDFTCKNEPWPMLRDRLTSYVAHILDAMNGVIDRAPSAGRAHRHIDIKVQDLAAGEQTANGLWHLDSSLHLACPFDNLLFVSGAFALTEFVASPLDFEAPPSAGAFHRAVVACAPATVRIPSCTIVRYDGTSVHRGPVAAASERRLLVRMVTTDAPLPRTPPRRIAQRVREGSWSPRAGGLTPAKSAPARPA